MFEKLVYKYFNIATTVSKRDCKRIYYLYKKKSIVFENGVFKKRLIIKKPKFKLPKHYYLYTGSYNYRPNKDAIDILVNKIYPRLIKKFANLYLVITGKGLPQNIIRNKKIIYFPNLKKDNLNYIIKNTCFLLLPLMKAPGTKLKIIEGLMLGAQIITTKNGMQGIEKSYKNQPIIYKNFNELDRSVNSIMRNIKKNQYYISKTKNFFLNKYSLDIITKSFIKKINQW